MKHQVREDEECSGNRYWAEVLARSKYLPAPEDSPVNFSYQDEESRYHTTWWDPWLGNTLTTVARPEKEGS